jgi:hypothetical protein
LLVQGYIPEAIRYPLELVFPLEDKLVIDADGDLIAEPEV